MVNRILLVDRLKPPKNHPTHLLIIIIDATVEIPDKLKQI